ncbi:hypothetical protein B5180_31775 [Streptomyces sp. BF-3]|nr:hypothetical protein B5180_31775 [Streptomyces sp. BF-3]
MHAGAPVQRTAATLTATLALVAIRVASAGAVISVAPAEATGIATRASVAVSVAAVRWTVAPACMRTPGWETCDGPCVDRTTGCHARAQ